jgi:hypothetical protein
VWCVRDDQGTAEGCDGVRGGGQAAHRVRAELGRTELDGQTAASGAQLDAEHGAQ